MTSLVAAVLSSSAERAFALSGISERLLVLSNRVSALSSASLAALFAVSARSYAVLTAFGVAASSSDTLSVALLSLTIPFCAVVAS